MTIPHHRPLAAESQAFCDTSGITIIHARHPAHAPISFGDGVAGVHDTPEITEDGMARKRKAQPKEVLGWWFAASDKLPHGDGRKVVIGEMLTVEPPIIPCEHGLHASVDAFDALQYAPGEILYRVRLSGEIVADNNDKHAASERTPLARRDATETLWAFARKMALSVAHLWDMPAVVREYLETGDESKRAAANAAAWDAARAAARDAARDAAWAAARDAAWAAARDAASAAAWAAARDAASAAAWAAASAAASAAAWAAARKLFNEMIANLFDGEI